MIIDGQAAFRSLLMHHLTAHWPDAIISAYDPVVAGQLPEEFSGAGNDIILLGHEQGDVDAYDTLARFTGRRGFPPVVFFARNTDSRVRANDLGARGFFPRKSIKHHELIVLLSEILQSGDKNTSSDFMFVGDDITGMYPSIKGYRVLEKLSISGHSAVYLAEEESTRVQVVLKMLRQSSGQPDSIGAFDRFLQEYSLIAGMDHPNIIKIHDLGVGDNHAHIVMEYLAGGDLKQKISRSIQTADAIRYAREIASALASIHSVGILHRDLKPANIMFRSDGSIALIDFGLAKRMRLNQEFTDSGHIFGTPYYMSPEQGHADDVDARSDIYSLGVIFYEMLTGDKPYLASNAMGIIFKHNEEPLPILPPNLAEYQAVLNLLLAKNPDDRLQHADELMEWL